MKNDARRRALLGFLGGACLLLSRSAFAAERGIFSLDDAGAVRLTNVPDDRRFSLLVQDLLAVPDPVDMPPVRRASRTAAAIEAQVRAFHPMIERASLAYKVEPLLIHAVIATESRYDPDAVSPKGAVGLMQLIPGTAKRYSVSNLRDPEQNIGGGVRYLRDLLTMFGGNLELALAAYNAGENAVLKYGNKIPPYKETQSYVVSVMEWQKRLRPFVGAI